MLKYMCCILHHAIIALQHSSSIFFPASWGLLPWLFFADTIACLNSLWPLAASSICLRVHGSKAFARFAARPLLPLLRHCVTSLGRKSHLSKKKNILFPPNPVVVTQSSRGLKAEEATNGKGKQRLHTILTFSMCAQLQFSAFILLIWLLSINLGNQLNQPQLKTFYNIHPYPYFCQIFKLLTFDNNSKYDINLQFTF